MSCPAGRGLSRQLGKVRGGFGLVEAAVLSAEPLLARGSSAKPGLASGTWQHRDVAEAFPQPGTDRLEELRCGPNLGPAVEPCRELGDDRRDVLGAHVQ